MTPDREREAERIFQDALDRPAGERAVFLARSCGEDPALLADVQDLLRHYAEAESSFLATPAVEAPPLDDPAASGSIGPYRLVKQLGEGGMGAVWLAEQDAPIRRQVALKIIRPGMASREIVARFEGERQALALMDHPGIARVFEAGTTDRGRPYFVMEHVDGVPITDYCDRERLDLRARIELLIEVCGAVQHAHQRGIIHRDLKPSNVLVAMEEGHPVPKVIDFGVAKAIAPEADGSSFVTSHGQVVGTPEFMSPEQARLTGADVDTRTDVYSLGMLLYLLLTGTLPFPPGELRALGLEDMLRRIREDEPTRPSERAAASGDDGIGIAAARRVPPERLPRILRGDLDWISMKALEKDRERRYPSASALAADLRRYLEDEPVSAGPPSASYRLRKFARRHRLPVAFAGSLAVLLIVFLGMLAGQAARIARERDRANQEAATAREVSNFLFELFEVSDPGRARGETITAREVLDEGAARIGDRFEGEPAVRARFQRSLGRVYRTLGLYEEAEPLLVQAMAGLRETSGPEHPETLEARHELASLYWNTGEYAAAEENFRACLEARRRDLGDDDAATLRTMSDLGLVLWSDGRYEEAERLHLAALEGLTRAFGPEDPEVLGVTNDLCLVYQSQGRYAEAEPLAVQTLEIRTRVLGPDHPLTLTSAHNLAFLMTLQGRPREAEALWRETLEIRTRVLGEEHRETLLTLGSMTWVVEDPEERERLQLRVIELSRKTLGDEHSQTLNARYNLAVGYYREGRFAEAAPIFVDVLEIRQRVLGPDHPSTLSGLHGVGMVYRNLERYEEAERYLIRALSEGARARGEDHPDTLRTMTGLAGLYARMHDDAEAERLFRLAYEGLTRVLGAEHPDTERTREEYAAFLESVGREEEAAALR